jgi:hypothetical protein
LITFPNPSASIRLLGETASIDFPQEIAGRHSPRSRFLIPPPSGCAIRIEIVIYDTFFRQSTSGPNQYHLHQLGNDLLFG